MSAVTHPILKRGWPELPSDTPILYEDEEAGEMGEVNRHLDTNVTLWICLKLFLRDHHPLLCVFGNMNCYYKPGPKNGKTGSLPYVSPDNMIVEPFEPLTEEMEEEVRTYTIGQDGPEPRVAIETLSTSTAVEGDLDNKVKLYAYLKVPEYILVDMSGEIMPQKLQLKRLQPDGTWKDEQDADGGVTSCLGFRLLIDETGKLVVVDKATGKRYARPLEAVEENLFLKDKAEEDAEARKRAEKKARDSDKKAQKEAEARKLADKKAQEEAEARKLADKRAQDEAEARKLADKKAQKEAEARKLADKKAHEEAEARKLADKRAQDEAKARRLAEQRLLALQDELNRLRSQPKDS